MSKKDKSKKAGVKSAIDIKKLYLRKLYHRSFKIYKSKYKTYGKIVLVIAIPAAIIGALQTNGLLSDYGQLLAVAWTFAFISTIYFCMHENKLEKASISSIYTAASGRILQFLGSSLVLALFAFPFGLGLIGLFFSLPALGLPPLVFLPISLAGLFVSGYLLSRFGLSQVIAVATENGVIESLKTSSILTKKNRWKIFFGTFLLIILYLIFLTFIQFLLNLNQSVSQNQFISNFVYVIEAIILVPIFFIYQTELYKELNG